MKVAIDAAHGGREAGVKAFGRAAKDDNLKLAKATGAALERCGVEVVMTRAADTLVNDLQRASACNLAGVDLVVALDRPGGGAGQTGLAFWAPSRARPEEMRLLAPLAAEVAGVAPVPYAGVQRGYPGNPGGDYKINRDTKAPSMLAQMLFVTSKADNAVFDEKLADYAEALCRGVCLALGREYSPPPAKDTKSEKKQGGEK